MERIEEALQKLFQKYRVVFWYDEKKELTEQFQAISLPGVEKIELSNYVFHTDQEALLPAGTGTAHAPQRNGKSAFCFF